MSFNQASDLEAQPSGWESQQYQDFPFDEESEQVEAQFNAISNRQQETEGLVKRLGAASQHETQTALKKIKRLLNDINERFQKHELEDKMGRLMAAKGLTRVQQTRQKKLADEFRAIKQTTQRLQSDLKSVQTKAEQAARAALQDGPGSPSQAGGSSQYGQQLELQEQLRLAPQDEVDFNADLIEERDRQLEGLQEGIMDINGIMKDVAHLVSEQGQQIDLISENVENTVVDTQRADAELRQANRYQKQSRSKACCLLLIMAVVLIIIVLAVVID